jgi:hypothetical protein
LITDLSRKLLADKKAHDGFRALLPCSEFLAVITEIHGVFAQTASETPSKTPKYKKVTSQTNILD